MTLYLHIGIMKTGTTFIQDNLYYNRDEMAKFGYIYPNFMKNKGNLHDHNPLVHKLYTCFWHKDEKWIEDECVHQFKEKGYKNVVISAENFSWQFTSKQSIAFLKEKFMSMGFTKIYILIYLRDASFFITSIYSQLVKRNSIVGYNNVYIDTKEKIIEKSLDSKKIIKNYIDVFGKENLIVRLFDKNEFYQGDLFKDFVHAIGLQWSDNFTISKKKTNESLDLIGIELQRRFNKKGLGGYEAQNKKTLLNFIEKHFTSNYDPYLKFQPPKEIIQSYIDYFKESNEWVRKEFFPHKESLFPKKDLTDYKENYELKE
ncbi:hypothetical protein CGR91_07870, partial [Campylobacter lari]|nr:hypothetical protein [Campylobacter lari]